MTNQQFILILLNFFALVWTIGNCSNNLGRIHTELRELNFNLMRLRERVGDNNGTVLSQIRDKMK